MVKQRNLRDNADRVVPWKDDPSRDEVNLACAGSEVGKLGTQVDGHCVLVIEVVFGYPQYVVSEIIRQFAESEGVTRSRKSA